MIKVIIQNNTMGGGILSLSVLQSKNTECRIRRNDKTVAGVEEVDIKVEEKQQPTVIISYFSCFK